MFTLEIRRISNATGKPSGWKTLYGNPVFATREQAHEAGCRLDRDGIFDKANVRIVEIPSLLTSGFATFTGERNATQSQHQRP